ncbi:MAG: right-handed parallel beta-helix repeat-containing protein, partial [Candidatus Omnitrophota bacterium]
KDNVTLRSASGRRENVVLDGAKSDHGELVGLRRCSGVTIADLTIQNIKWNGFKINSDSNVQKVIIHNCIIHNIWQRGVKGVKVPLDKLEEYRPKDCIVEYCLFYNDHAKQFSDDPADVPTNFNGNYIGGIDIMYAKNWIIRHNVFIGIQGRTREGRGCVFLWHEGEDCLIDGNIILNCDVGIALGNSSGIGEGQSRVHCSRFTVRNNFITNTPESGIVADYTKECRIVNNTIHDPGSRLQRLIRIVHSNEGLFAANNVLSGPELQIESTSRLVLKNNLAKILTPYFADPQNGNLHWKTIPPNAAGQAESLPDVPTDIDGEPRGEKPDLGADEFMETSAVSNGE